MRELSYRSTALLPLISALFLFTTIVFYLAKAKKSSLLLSFLVSVFIFFLWPLGQALQYCAANYQILVHANYFIHTSINFLGLAWLIFIIHFTSGDGMIHWKKITPFMIMPLITYAFFLTDSYHHLYFQTLRYDPELVFQINYGPFLWLGILVTLSYITTGVLIMIRYAARQTGVVKSQAYLLAYGSLPSLLMGITYTIYVSVIPIPKFPNLTPTFFSVSLLIFAWAVYRYRFLNINPGALDKVFRNLLDPTLVIDHYHCIINYNDSFFQDFGRFKVNDKTNPVVNHLRTMVSDTEETDRILQAIELGIEQPVLIGEIMLKGPVHKTYQVVIQRLDHHQKASRGRIVVFHDITEYKRLHAELDLKNNELAITNERLRVHLRTIEELAIADERNRVAREVHDTLGHSLTVLILLMKAVKIEAEVDLADSSAKLAEGIKIAQAELAELRRSINGLMAPNMQDPDLIDSIDSLVRQTETLGVGIEFSVFEREIYYQIPVSIHKLRLSDTIYKICKEAITNSLRHGFASQINIIIKFSRNKAQLFVIDNGRGAKNINYGMGLSGMADRVKDLNGTIKFGSDGETGFHIHAELPMEAGVGI